MRLFGFCALVSLALVLSVRCAPGTTQRTKGSAPERPAKEVTDAGVDDPLALESDATAQWPAVSPHFLGPVPQIRRKLTVSNLPVVGRAPLMAVSGSHVWLLFGKELYLHSGRSVVRRTVLCDQAVPQETRYYVGLYADASGALALGKSTKQEPVVAKISYDGKLTCKIVRAKRLALASISGPDGVWVTKTDAGPFEFGSAGEVQIPSTSLGYPVPSRLFAPARNGIWLETFDGSPFKKLKTLYYDGSRWREVENLNLPIVRALAEDASGNIWAVARPMSVVHRLPPPSHTQFLSRFDGTDWRHAVVPVGFSADGIRIYGNEFWMHNSGGIWLRKNRDWRSKRVPATYALEVDAKGRVFVLGRTKPRATTWVLRRFDPPKRKIVP